MADSSVLRALCVSLWLLCLLPAQVTAIPFFKRQTTPLTLDQIQKQALDAAYQVLDGTLQDGMTRTKGCTKANVAIRKEYGDMTKDERSAYIKAVQCILKKPSKLPAGQYPGAKSRYDDFVVVHMNMTPSVHSTANFMHWHRYYIWAYETALKEECGYTGTQPYWNWAKYTDLPKSPIFNGDDWSMGGNGDPVKHSGGMMGIPAGPGGGCVTTGPFANLTIHLGPLMSTMDSALKIPSNPRADGFGDNPRCLRRDVNNYFVTQYIRAQDLVEHLTATTNNAIGRFQDTLQSGMAGKRDIHGSGHFSIWGDPGGDVYVSPAEPTFWLHHGQLDRHWWMWQNYRGGAEVAKRTVMYEGGTNWMNPSSARGKATDPQWLNVVAPSGMEGLLSNQLFSTTSGLFCYVYQ